MAEEDDSICIISGFPHLGELDRIAEGYHMRLNEIMNYREGWSKEINLFSNPYTREDEDNSANLVLIDAVDDGKDVLNIPLEDTFAEVHSDTIKAIQP
ncbi:hypothetical protein A0H81_11059 [Grifola frondosa]|uniref:Uncharacterized protein n=1 Tax=Grifola frondosa TaxID=5627 RepID=A0A1C7LX51_GRIFR|nr:hypothetical protein A0H81_11059 [Grifola frondosa]